MLRIKITNVDCKRCYISTGLISKEVFNNLLFQISFYKIKCDESCIFKKLAATVVVENGTDFI